MADNFESLEEVEHISGLPFRDKKRQGPNYNIIEIVYFIYKNILSEVYSFDTSLMAENY